MFTKYFENGLSVIPIRKGQKIPVIPGWSKYCDELPTEDQVEQWDNKDYNIGIACGKASGVIVVDIDTDDKSVLDRCPKSPVVRRGAKGEARFFKYNKHIQSVSPKGAKIDILSGGKQIVVPPSIHPATGEPYVWLTPDTLDSFDLDDLPELTDMSFLQSNEAVVVSAKTEGRNNHLVGLVTSMRSRGESEELIVNEVFEYDRDNHNPPLFSDKSEGFRGDARTNAWKFVNRVSSTLISKGIAVIGDAPKVVVDNDNDELLAEELFKPKDFPKMTGLLGDITQLIINESERYMPNLAIGAAYSLLSVLCANRYRFGNTWPNLYIMNLAQTGAGKSFPQKIIKDLLAETELLGYGSYKSSSAITKNLVSKPIRLDVIDEFSSPLGQIKTGGPYQAEMLEELCKLWSESNTLYIASEYAGKENTSTCYNPCVSILGSSTIEGVKANSNNSMITKGLLPRFLTFAHEDYGPIKEPTRDEALHKKVKKSVAKILKLEKRLAKAQGNVLYGTKFDPIDLAPTNKDAIEFYEKLRLDYAKKLEDPELPESMKSMGTRLKEQVMKLAVCNCVSNRWDRKDKNINLDDLKLAAEVVDASIFNSRPFIEEIGVGTDWERHVNKVFQKIKQGCQGKHLTHGILSNRFPAINLREMDQIIKKLLEMGKIERFLKENKANKMKSTAYKPLN